MKCETPKKGEQIDWIFKHNPTRYISKIPLSVSPWSIYFVNF